MRWNGGSERGQRSLSLHADRDEFDSVVSVEYARIATSSALTTLVIRLIPLAAGYH